MLRCFGKTFSSMMKQILGKNDSKTVQEILGKNVEVFWQNV